MYLFGRAKVWPSKLYDGNHSGPNHNPVLWWSSNSRGDRKRPLNVWSTLSFQITNEGITDSVDTVFLCYLYIKNFFFPGQGAALKKRIKEDTKTQLRP